jgi:hypothetical protein
VEILRKRQHILSHVKNSTSQDSVPVLHVIPIATVELSLEKFSAGRGLCIPRQQKKLKNVISTK